ncbi:MAG TPA: PaaI family thioesterase [Pseudomonadales bacterium]|nr:PaaI family thioesterase [Pseudomonadales bacterium]
MSASETPDPRIPEGFGEGKGPYSRHIGPLLYKRDTLPDGRVQGWVGILVQPHHVGANDRGHGGLMLTLLDEALGMNAALARNRTPVVTVSMQTNFIGATLPGEFLVATGYVQQLTTTMAFMEGKAWCGDRLVGTASGVWKFLRKPEPK